MSAADPLAIYLHWPFCAAKCPYCDFNSHVSDRVDQARWRAALLTELRHAAEPYAGRAVASVFFGGGTPSLMEPDTAGALIGEIRRLFTAPDDLEITLEANPGTMETGRFGAFRDAGVNRVSLGVQSLYDDQLAFLGRIHDAAQAKTAIREAIKTFDRVSFDLIYARPGQSVADWQAELDEALDFGTEHLSVYQLTMEPGTKFHTLWRRGEIQLPEEDLADTLYDTTLARLADAGLPAYEVSNHARPGAESRHNLVYWRYGDYLGVGPGAHGRVSGPDGTGWATRRHRAPEIWLDRVERDGHALQPMVPLSAPERFEEMVMMGLRLAEPVPDARARKFSFKDWRGALPTDRVDDLVESGDIVLNSNGLRATDQGRKRLNGVLGYLLR